MSRVNCFGFASLSLVLLGALAGCHASAAEDPPVAQRPQRGGGGGGRGGSNLFANETVQKDLALTAGQKDSIKKISDDFRKSMSGLNQTDRQTKMAELRKTMDDKIDAVLNATQKARIKEIRLQVQGPAALSTKEVAAAIRLSDDQVKQIVELTKGLENARRETLQFGGSGRNADVREQLTILQTEATEKILAVLDSDQQASFEKMQGAKIDLPAGGLGGGGNRRGGNRGGNAGGNAAGNAGSNGSGKGSGNGN
jgi:Spy/CpxP family protein refolding chaperone